jgi:hypothetical protein
VQGALLALLGAGTLAVWIVAVFLPDRRPFSSQGGSPPPLATATAPAPASPSAAAIAPKPEAVTLRVTDLPPGYHVLKTGPALFSASAGPAPPTGWDVVFAPDAGRQTDELLVESAAAVYPDAGTAAAAVQTESEAEQAAHALRQVPIPGLGDQQAVWIEPAPDRPGYGIVRVVWQSLNVVGQVSVLGPIDPSQPQQTGRLAMVEQGRISSPAAPGAL